MKIIVGRFQCDRLTEGQKKLISNVLDKGPDNICIFIGETKNSERTFHDPLPYEYRERMVRQFIGARMFEREQKNIDWEKYKYHVFMIRDIGNIELWNKQLDERIQSLIDLGVIKDDEEIILCGSRDSFIQTYNGKYPTFEVPPYTGEENSATQLRENILKKDLREEVDPYFAQGIIWAYGKMEEK